MYLLLQPLGVGRYGRHSLSPATDSSVSMWLYKSLVLCLEHSEVGILGATISITATRTHGQAECHRRDEAEDSWRSKANMFSFFPVALAEKGRGEKYLISF